MVDKPKRKTEWLLSIVGSALAGGLATGVIPPDIFEIGKAAVETAQASASAGASDVQVIVDAVYKLIAMATGGWVITSYNKSRGTVKAAEAKATKTEFLNESQ